MRVLALNCTLTAFEALQRKCIYTIPGYWLLIYERTLNTIIEKDFERKNDAFSCKIFVTTHSATTSYRV